jgi:hypothetical protein
MKTKLKIRGETNNIATEKKTEEKKTRNSPLSSKNKQMYVNLFISILSMVIIK